MKRSGFARRPPPPSLARVKQWEGTVRPRSVAVALVDPLPLGRPVLKEEPIQHSGYMKLVRQLPCARCKTVAVPRQFAHSDAGKGLALKTDCRLGWPGCFACHYLVGSSGALGKEGRRRFEAEAAAQTRAAILRAGTWPKRLPLWIET